MDISFIYMYLFKWIYIIYNHHLITSVNKLTDGISTFFVANQASCLVDPQYYIVITSLSNECYNE